MTVSRVRGRGMSMVISSLICACGPGLISRMRSESRMASSTSWVTMNTVMPVSCHIRTSSFWMTPRVSASIWAKGSSNNRMRGLTENARANPTRYFMPPERDEGFLWLASLRPTISINFWTCWLILSRLHSGYAALTASLMFPKTFIQGIRAKF